MARIARLVIPELPHHVTQRGNRREQVFFDDGDYLAYLDLLREALVKSQAEIWNYGDSLLNTLNCHPSFSLAPVFELP